MSEKTNWLEELKIGDKVFIKRTQHGEIKRIVGTVEKITNTQIHTKKYKFRKKDSRVVGDTVSYMYTEVEEFDSEIYSELLKSQSKKRIIEYIKSVDYDKITLAGMYRIEELIKLEESYGGKR